MIRKKLIRKSDQERIRFRPIEFIIIHASVSGGTAKNLIKHVFSRRDRPVLVDYLVEDNQIYQLNDSDNYYPWSIGIDAKSEEPISNANIISVELMNDIKGKISKPTLYFAQKLVRDLMSKYSIGIDNVLRFTDVSHRHGTGMLTDSSTWNEFKKGLGEVTK